MKISEEKCWRIRRQVFFTGFVIPALVTTKVGASHLDVDVDRVLGVVADHRPHVVEEEDNLKVPLQGRLQKMSLVPCRWRCRWWHCKLQGPRLGSYNQGQYGRQCNACSHLCRCRCWRTGGCWRHQCWWRTSDWRCSSLTLPPWFWRGLRAWVCSLLTTRSRPSCSIVQKHLVSLQGSHRRRCYYCDCFWLPPTTTVVQYSTTNGFYGY